MATAKSSERKTTTTKRPTISSSHTSPRAAKPAAKKSAPSPAPKKAAASKANGARPTTAKQATAKAPLPKTKTGALAAAAKKPAKKKALPAPESRKDGKRAPKSGAEDTQKELRDRALQIAASGLDKKALDIAIIDVLGKVDYADFLVLMTGTSDRHVASIVQAVEEDQKKRGHRALSVEGLPVAEWVLVDFGDLVVHVFQEDARGTYDIDGLWMDAKRVPVDAQAKALDRQRQLEDDARRALGERPGVERSVM